MSAAHSARIASSIAECSSFNQRNKYIVQQEEERQLTEQLRPMPPLPRPLIHLQKQSLWLSAF